MCLYVILKIFQKCIYFSEYRQIQNRIMKMCIYISIYRQIQDTDLYVDEPFMILCTYFYEYRQIQIRSVYISQYTGKYNVQTYMWMYNS